MEAEQKQIKEILFGGKVDEFLIQAYTEIIDNKFNVYEMRDFIANYTKAVPGTCTYDHAKIDLISRCLIGSTARYPKGAAFLMNVMLAPFYDQNETAAPWEIESRQKIRNDCSEYYALGLTLGIFRSLNWLDKNKISEGIEQVEATMPDIFETLVFCDNALADIPQINQMYESEISKEIKAWVRHHSENRPEAVKKIIDGLSNALKKRTYVLSEFGQMLLKQLG
ncbi:MAG: hypothetical protein NTX00_02120, partial [Candidatus Parcubacteria bacterium]|nr:hypothetical protein [Candidatus Parcubacteria bacterium]